jgi:WG containing repeat
MQKVLQTILTTIILNVLFLMKSLPNYIFILINLFIFNALNAQQLSDQITAKKTFFASNTVSSKSLKTTETTEEARRIFKALFNHYRDFSITIDTIELAKTDIESKNPVETTPQNFSAYLDKMTTILTKKKEAVNNKLPNAASQLSHYSAGLNTLKSAKCLQTDKPQSTFTRTRDMDNNAIMAFDLNTIRSGSRYGLVENYREGFARIRKDQVYGYLNLCGDETIICQYERAEPFNAGMALVKRVDWFFIDGEGNETDALENIAEAKALKNGISWARTTDNKMVLIDNDYARTKVVLSKFYDEIVPFYNNDVFRVRNGKKVGLITLTGKTIFDVAYDEIEPTNVSGIYRISQNKNVGLLDTTWALRTPLSYEAVSNFNEYGVALAKNKMGLTFIKSTDYKTSKFYNYVTDFNEFGVSIIRNEINLYGLIDSNLTVITPTQYASIGNFNELGLASACHPDGKCGFIKYDGKEQIKANYESVGTFNSYGLAVARTVVEHCNGKNEACKAEVIIDKNGNTIVPVSDESIAKNWRYQLTDSLFTGDKYLIINVLENERSLYLLVEKNTFQLITGTPYQAIMAMDRLGNFRVKKDGKWGMIDSTGKILARPTYQAIERIHDGHYATQNDKGKWGFLNKKGKPQIPFEYEEVQHFKSGFAPVSKGRGKWGLITHFNAKIVPCAFRSVVLNKTETKFEVTDEDNLVYSISETGECETNCPKFEKLRAAANKIEDLDKKK